MGDRNQKLLRREARQQVQKHGHDLSTAVGQVILECLKIAYKQGSHKERGVMAAKLRKQHTKAGVR